MISHLNGGNTMQPPEPVRSHQEFVRQLFARGSFVAHCAGYSCGTALYHRDDYRHSALGTYCKRCWHDIEVDIRAERTAR